MSQPKKFCKGKSEFLGCCSSLCRSCLTRINSNESSHRCAFLHVLLVTARHGCVAHGDLEERPTVLFDFFLACWECGSVPLMQHLMVLAREPHSALKPTIKPLFGPLMTLSCRRDRSIHQRCLPDTQDHKRRAQNNSKRVRFK